MFYEYWPFKYNFDLYLNFLVGFDNIVILNICKFRQIHKLPVFILFNSSTRVQYLFLYFYFFYNKYLLVILALKYNIILYELMK